MNNSDTIHSKMEEMFCTRPWRGVVSVDEALAYAIHYRDCLPPAEQELYDEQILSGRHPSNAQELIEIMRERGYFATKELATTAAGV